MGASSQWVAARRLVRRVVTDPLVWVAVVWLALNLAWVRVYRWSRFAELDEAAYTRLAASFQRQETWSDSWRVITTEGNHGPLQALLAYVPMKATVPDIRIVIGLNLVLTVAAALATADLTNRLAGRGAALVAGLLVLLAPGVVEFSRLALTATAPVSFAAIALAALARSEGLRRPGWAAAAGIAIGCMTLGRSMAIGFVPAVAVAGSGWAWSARTPLVLVLRNGLLVAATALGTAAWWWYARWSAVSEYLFGGGSSDTERVRDPVGKPRDHLDELMHMTGPVLALGLIVAAAAFSVVALRRPDHLRAVGDDDEARRPVPSDAGEDADDAGGPRSRGAVHPPTTWPLWTSVVVGLLSLGASTAYGTGFVLPLIPAAVAATTVTGRRALDRAPLGWMAWASVMIIGTGIAAVTWPGTGLRAELSWCAGEQARTRAYCEIRDTADGRAWQRVNDHVADRIMATIQAAAEEDPHREASVALTPRDLGVSTNMVSLSMEVRHEAGVDLSRFFRPDDTIEQQLADVVDDAALVIVVPDLTSEPVLATHSPRPVQVLAVAAQSRDFRTCDELTTPDGRTITILVADWVPDIACRRLPTAGTR